MNKKELKELIIERGGKIINCRKFLYRGQTYYFAYFIKDWEQRNFMISRHKIKQEYKAEVNRFINEKDILEENEELTAGDIIVGIFDLLDLGIIFIPIFLIIFLPYSIYYIFRTIRNTFSILFLSKKKEYESLEKRVKVLEKWLETFPEFYYIKPKPEQKLYWAFEKFIINNYALATNKEIVLSIENYAKMKNVLKVKENLKKRKNKSI